MSNTLGRPEDEEIQEPQRPPSPPPHMTFSARGIHAPSFTAFRPHDVRIPSSRSLTHVAWSCDGRKLAAVGVDKIVRIWTPEKSMEPRASTSYTGGHSDDVTYVAWDPTHHDLFCSASSLDRRIVFWDVRQSRSIQQISLKVEPLNVTYSPTGRLIAYSSTNSVGFLTKDGGGSDSKDIWRTPSDMTTTTWGATNLIFSHAGDGILAVHTSKPSIGIFELPSVRHIDWVSAHPRGCAALALDPRGRYVASGGHDAIINLFETNEWLCARSITSCDHDINALSFSYDGEYIAVACKGSYIDIIATETGLPLHRVHAPSPSPTVTWHPSRHIFAYCGHVKTGTSNSACLSLFGPGSS